jgi:hypothetical protein
VIKESDEIDKTVTTTSRRRILYWWYLQEMKSQLLAANTEITIPIIARRQINPLRLESENE